MQQAVIATVNISIHPPREGWDSLAIHPCINSSISIHPPREGWDSAKAADRKQDIISIHPPREGWDAMVRAFRTISINFNPPTP